MKKKGFTLIELLAVIVILGIITVIAVPKILDIINKSRESAASSSIKLVKDAIKTQVASSDLTGPVFTKESDGCYIFNFDDQTIGNVKTLEIKNKDKISGSIKYCNNTFSDDTLKFDGNSISKGDTKRPICKRATILHTEECLQTDTTYFCSGAGYTTNGSKGTSTITYGNLGTIGTLSSGDAFDCDVNGDGIYDSSTERFYYVSDYYNTSTKSFEDDTAVLVYYNNVSSGNSNNSNLYAYDSSGENFHGPRTAISQLPTTKQWDNVSLKNTSRAILNEKETYSNDFSYTECSSRVLTTQEVNKSCNITTGSFNYGELDSCNFLIENTNYSSDNIKNTGFWLESPYSGDSVHVWYITSKQREQSYRGSADDTGIGIRPAIEVSKTNIEY